MKKKLLAMILCITLCIVPLPFSVSALQIVDGEIFTSSIEMNAVMSIHEGNCNCIGSLTPYEYGVRGRAYVATAAVCYRDTYSYVKAICQTCGADNIFYDISQDYSHASWAYYTDDNGIPHKRCPYCSYLEY